MSTLTYAMPRAEARPTSLRAAFAVLVLAMLPAVLDQTVLATALPTIAGELGSIGDVSHLVTVYVLASTATTPLWGKLGDRHGRRALLGVALSLFLLASAACGARAEPRAARDRARHPGDRRRRADVARDGERRRPRRPARARPLAGPHRDRVRRRGRRRAADRRPARRARVVALGLLRQPARRPRRPRRPVALPARRHARGAPAAARPGRRRPARRRQRVRPARPQLGRRDDRLDLARAGRPRGARAWRAAPASWPASGAPPTRWCRWRCWPSRPSAWRRPACSSSPRRCSP